MNDNKFTQDYYNWEIGKIESAPFITSAVKHILESSKSIRKETKDLEVLDVGSGTGQYSFEIAKKVISVLGVEPFRPAYEFSKIKERRNNFRKRVYFLNTRVEKLKTKRHFDLILCLATLEHMPDPEDSFKAMFKLLRKGGLIYITVPNRLWPYEYHYRLFFLSWLPIKLANKYVRFMNRGKSYEDCSHSLTYFGLRKFLNKYPCKYEFIVPDPNEKFVGLQDSSLFYNIIKNIGLRMLKKFPILWVFSKAFILVVSNVD